MLVWCLAGEVSFPSNWPGLGGLQVASSVRVLPFHHRWLVASSFSYQLELAIVNMLLHQVCGLSPWGRGFQAEVQKKNARSQNTENLDEQSLVEFHQTRLTSGGGRKA